MKLATVRTCMEFLVTTKAYQFDYYFLECCMIGAYDLYWW
jgi:hypothetical protein